MIKDEPREIHDSTPYVMKLNKLVYLQIDNGEPFIPEQLGRTGTEYGVKEATGENISSYQFGDTRYATIEYILNGLYCREYYKSGKWEEYKGCPLFHVEEALI